MPFEDSLDFSTILRLAAGALVGILFGAFLGAGHLISHPVKLVDELPDDLRPGKRYILKGRTAGGDAWKYKASELQEGKDEVSFLETELNRWASTFSTEYPDEKPGIFLEPEKPLFRLENDTLLVSAKADSGFGIWRRSVTLSCQGNFERTDGLVQIEPEKLYIGCLRVPGPAKHFVWKRLASAYKVDDEFQSLWASIDSANIHESQLILIAKR